MPSFRPSWLSRMLSVLLSLTLLLTLSGCAPSQEFGLQNRPPVDPATYFGRDYEDQAAIMTELKEKTSPIFENSDVDIITTGEIEIVDSLPEDESSESSHTEESSENSESSENHESSENSENSESSENHESSESSESSEASSSESSESSSESSENSENSTTGGTFLAHDHTPFFTWGRDQLTPAEQEGYDIICDYIANYRTDTITLPLTYDEVYRIADAIDMDRPDFYWYFYDLRMLNNGDGTLSLWAYSMDNNATGYSMSKETAVELEDWIDQEVELILSGVDSSWSDYEKALYVYNYLTRNVVYDIDTLNDQSPVAALVYHRAVCASYAEAFQYLMLELGIPSTKAVGYATGDYSIGHAWVMVQLDGYWYYLDPTWDSWEDTDYTHIYFCLSADEISKDHEIDNPLPLPEATSMMHNYFAMEGYIMDRWDLTAYASHCYKQAQQGYKIFEVKFTTYDAYMEAYKKLSSMNLYELEQAIDPSGSVALSGDFYGDYTYYVLVIYCL